MTENCKHIHNKSETIPPPTPSSMLHSNIYTSVHLTVCFRNYLNFFILYSYSNKTQIYHFLRLNPKCKLQNYMGFKILDCPSPWNDSISRTLCTIIFICITFIIADNYFSPRYLYRVIDLSLVHHTLTLFRSSLAFNHYWN